MFADVIPLLRLPRRQRVFTYRLPDDLATKAQPGMLVRVSWRGKPVDGIIFSLSPNTTIPKVRDILALHETIPSWTDVHLRVFTEEAEPLFCSYGDFARQFVPDVPKKTLNPKPRSLTEAEITQIEPAIETQLKVILSKEKRHPQTLHVRHAAERFAFYRLLACQHPGQILFLAPTKFDAEDIEAALLHDFPKETLLIRNEQNKTRQWQDWQNVRDGKVRLVVATRSGVMLPCRNLSCIVIDQDERHEHAQWEAQPRYDSRTIATNLSRKRKIALWHVGYAPRVQSTQQEALHHSGSAVVPLRTVLHASANPPLADLTTEAIEDTIASGKRVLVITQHKAVSRTMRCLDCRHAWSCDSCKHPLSEDTQGLFCQNCKARYPRPMDCPKCHSQRIRGYGLGQQGLKRVLAPYSKTGVTIIDTLTEDVDPKADFLISTPYACKRLERTDDNIGLLLMHHPEQVLFTPSYAANELYNRLIQWHRIFAMDRLSCPILVQSSLPENHQLHSDVVADTYEAFLKRELEMRKRLSFPPFGDVWRISLKSPLDRRAQTLKECDSLVQTLKDTPSRLMGPRMAKFSPTEEEITWLLRTPPGSKLNLDKTPDSIYNKLVIVRNPE